MANNSIYNELQSKHMIEAFAMLTTKVNSLNNWQLQEELEQAESTYNDMLSFIAKGVKDPDRHRILYGIIRTAYSINDRANAEIRLKKHPTDKYCQTYTHYKSEPFDIANLRSSLEVFSQGTDMLKKGVNNSGQGLLPFVLSHQDKMLGQAFDWVWTSSVWDASDYSMYLDIISDEKIQTTARSLIISAVTLAAFEIFDQSKIMLLFDAYLDKDTMVSQRALVGLLLLIVRYDSRILFYPQIETRFKLYAENKQFVRDCFRVLTQLQYSNFTDTVTMKMTNDIMPAIMNSPKYKPNKHHNPDKRTNDNEANPEWTANTDKDNKAEKKMQQMSELQQEGADIYWTTFRYLKRFDFFDSIHHWLIPFTYDMPMVRNAKNELSPEIIDTIKRMFSLPAFCDSDKYSFILMFVAMDSGTQTYTVNNIQSQIGDITTEELSQEGLANKITAENASKSYIQDLYRFFKIYPFQSQFFDPFRKGLQPFVPYLYNLLRNLIPGNYDEVLSMADFMMRWEYYLNAIDLYKELAPKEREEDAYIWQRIAFCYQKMGLWELAIKNYETAYKLQPNSDWTLRHLAQTEFDCSMFPEAAGHIDMILKNDDKNPKWLLLRAKCHIRQGDYEESIPVLYKATYIDEKSDEAQKLLIHSLVETGSGQKAEKISREMAEKNPTAENLITLGHMLLYNGKDKEAFDTYSKCYQQTHDKEKFRQTFWSESTGFVHNAEDGTSFQLMFDAVTTWKEKADD